jgi:hypothetical protein
MMSVQGFRSIFGRLFRAQFAADDVRAALFPDPSLRMDAEHPTALFDPFSLCLSLEAPPPFSDDRKRLMRGEIEEIKKDVLPEFWLKSGPERLGYILHVTSGIHELRHYHDHFGTTFGFHRVLRTINDAIEFNRVWNALKKEPKICLPLGEWGKSAEAPQILREYLQQRRQYVEWFTVADHATTPPKLGPAEVVLVFAMRGLSAVVPTVTLNIGKPGIAASIYQKSVPLGGRALLEGNAVAVQRIFTSWVFGKRYRDELNAFVRQGSPHDDRWLDYAALEGYLGNRLGKFYDWAQLVFSDLAMMAENPEDLMNEHPGIRLSKVVTAALAGKPLYRQTGINFASYLDQLTRELKWKPVRDVARRALVAADKHIAQLRTLTERDTMWPRILAAVHSLHRDFMRIRVKQPHCLVDPWIYTALLPHLPQPPVIQEGRSLTFRGADDTDAAVFGQWFFFEHFQRHMLSQRELPCAGGLANHRCPGNALRKGWTPLDTCMYSQFLGMLGVPDVVFAKA